MSEIEKLMKYAEDKSVATQKSYNQLYRRLRALLGNRDIVSASEKMVLKVIQSENINSKQGLINIAILLRKLDDMPKKLLEDTREANKKLLQTHVKEKNADVSDLPSYEDITEYTEELYTNGEYTSFIINYLMLNFFVRNKDLNFTIVKRKKDMTDDTINYMWLSSNKAVYRRNDYKTKDTYKTKEHVITDPKFLLAMKRVQKCQESELECGTFIPNENQIGYYIKKATLKNIGETAYLKIIMNHFKTDLQKVKQIGESRGTATDTLIESYDLDNK
jgi:hypothetical protein